MIFFLHYILMTSGLSGVSVLLGVYFRAYTDASQAEIGALLMTFPFVSMFIKPIFCSMADRHQAHRKYMLAALAVEMAGYAPFAVIPFFPSLYLAHPRVAWYLLVVACHVGNGGLNVAWSLGDCLAMNYSAKTGTPFGRMRLMGTLGWGVYGFIIGQINETPLLPKYLPAFIILHASLLIELAMVSLWREDDFVMVDPLSEVTKQRQQHEGDHQTGQLVRQCDAAASVCESKFQNSIPSSLSGTLRMSAATARVFCEALANDELDRKLKKLQRSGSSASWACGRQNSSSANHQPQQQHPSTPCATPATISATINRANVSLSAVAAGSGERAPRDTSKANPQVVLLKFLLAEDGRLLKYLALFVAFGLLIAPMNFIFLSMEEVCRDASCNFSQLAGAVLISQALIETLGFLVVPWCMNYLTRSFALSFSLFIMSLRYFFYSGWYYTSHISPYWSVVCEWTYGISFAFFTTIQCDVAFMLANQSRLFIPELRRMGLLSEPSKCSREVQEAEERGIKMALRATMCSLFSGAQDGLGQGLGALLCGIFIELYSYIRVWQIIGAIAIAALLLHQLVELTRSRWSDTYRPRKGTKAYEIVQFNAQLAAAGGGGGGGESAAANKDINIDADSFRGSHSTKRESSLRLTKS